MKYDEYSAKVQFWIGQLAAGLCTVGTFTAAVEALTAVYDRAKVEPVPSPPTPPVTGDVIVAVNLLRGHQWEDVGKGYSCIACNGGFAKHNAASRVCCCASCVNRSTASYHKLGCRLNELLVKYPSA